MNTTGKRNTWKHRRPGQRLPPPANRQPTQAERQTADRLAHLFGVDNDEQTKQGNDKANDEQRKGDNVTR